VSCASGCSGVCGVVGHVSSFIVIDSARSWESVIGNLSCNDGDEPEGVGVLSTDWPEGEVRRRFRAGLASLSSNGFGRVEQDSEETARSVDSRGLAACWSI
jgi:hypothetical protein